MPDDPSHQPPGVDAGAEAPTEPAPTPSSPSDARAFAELFEQEICRIVRAGEALAPRAWILGRRHPLTKVLYAANRYGLFICALGELDSEEHLEVALARVRAVAKRSAALGIALAFEIRYQPRADESQAAPQDAVYLVVEHRALPHPHRRIFFVPPSGQGRDDLACIDLAKTADDALPLFANRLKSVPPLLPELD